LGKRVTSQNIPLPLESSEKRTVPKQIKTAESIIVLRKNQKVPRTTHDTLRPRVIGVTKKRRSAINFDIHRRVPLFSTIQFPIKSERVISGNIKVISCTQRYIPSQRRHQKSDS
jgi:hypothetical protein